MGAPGPRLNFPLRRRVIDPDGLSWSVQQGKAATHARSPKAVSAWREGEVPDWWALRANQPPPPQRSLTAGEQAQVDHVLNQLQFILARTQDRTIDCFLQWDRDNSGKLDRAEFRMALSGLGVMAARSAFDLTFAVLDTDRGGTVDYRELHKFIRRRVSGPSFRKAMARKDLDLAPQVQGGATATTVLPTLKQLDTPTHSPRSTASDHSHDVHAHPRAHAGRLEDRIAYAQLRALLEANRHVYIKGLSRPSSAHVHGHKPKTTLWGPSNSLALTNPAAMRGGSLGQRVHHDHPTSPRAHSSRDSHTRTPSRMGLRTRSLRMGEVALDSR